MATWVPIPASGYAETAAQEITAQNLTGSNADLSYTGPPNWVSAPNPFSLINPTNGQTV